MRICDVVLHELFDDTNLSFVEKAVCLGATAYPADSIASLAARLRIPKSTALYACRNLSKRGWMDLRRTGRKLCPIPLVPRTCQVNLARALEKDYNMAANKGEFLMKRHLDLRIHSEEFLDNARPKFLTNPMTDEPLEYDRYYLQGVAFEFNGLQHSIMTRVHRDENALREVKTRDLLKRALSEKAQVNLITVMAEDLRPGAFERLLPRNLPQKVIDESGPYYRTLAKICIAYDNKTQQEAARIAGLAKPATQK